MQLRRLVLAVLLVAHGLPTVFPAMNKQALVQMQNMMRNMCKGKTGVSPQVMAKAKAGNFEEDPKLKCYLKCCLGMMQTMKNNKISVESATKQIDSLLPDEMKEPTLKQLHACKDSTGTDSCDLAYQFTVCSYNYDKGNFFIPL
ncbi:UNVERIFIED_CONTAM: hypothetical protein PYX00_002130 [Menopon gallinae]|uniref:Uncharacterized protein n=1 Tax=Menopon gallinae TaxID=328185 RepID=A0AAW2IFR1_9NEOP